MKKLLVVAAVAGLVGTANAQSAFEGFFVGVNTGTSYGQFKTSTTTPYLPSGYSVTAGTYFGSSVNAMNVSNSGSGNLSNFQALGGIAVGYNKHIPTFGIIGIEADYSYIGLNSSQTNSTTYPGLPSYTPQSKITTTANNLATLRLKYGFNIEKNSLAYLTAGGAYTTIKSNLYFNDGEASLTNNQSKNKFGWALGAGGEYLFSKTLSLKLEYLYVSFGNVTSTSNNLSGGGDVFPNQPFTTSTNLNISTLRIGLNKYF
jgi:outer membrane immunogenic protein